MRKRFYLFFIFLISFYIYADNFEFIKKISDNFNLIQSFYMKVNATLESLDDDKKSIKSWKFYYKFPGSFYIDYTQDGLNRKIISNYEYVWEYIPAQKAVLQTDIRRLSDKKKQRKITKSLVIVQLPFLFINDTLKILKKRKIEEKDSKYFITGYFKYNKKKTFIKIWIDKKKLCPEKVDLFQKDILVLSGNFSDFKKFDFLYFPNKLVYIINSENRHVKFTAEIKDLRINIKIPDNKFVFDIYNKDKGLEIFKKIAK